MATLGPDGSVYFAYACNTNFAASTNAYQKVNAGNLDVTVVRLNSTGTGLLFATPLGGSGEDLPSAISVDPAGSAMSLA